MSDGRFVGDVQASRKVNGLVLAETLYPAGLTIAPHPHAEALCSVVLEGAMTERLGRRRVDCTAGILTYLPPDEPHGQEYHAPDSRCFLIQLGSSWMDRMRELGVDPSIGPLDLQHTKANWLAGEIYREFQSGDAASSLSVEGFVLAMLGEISRGGTPRERGAKPGWLIRAVEILHARMGEQISFADIAAEVNTHPTHLSRTFREHFGSTMGEYLRRIRIDAAREALANTTTPLATIALDAGFADQAHFSRAFKRLTGETPGAWRRLHAAEARR